MRSSTGASSALVAAIGHVEHVRHFVADEHDWQLAPLHVQDCLQHAAGFLDAERGGATATPGAGWADNRSLD
jgi:hypothetical protein